MAESSAVPRTLAAPRSYFRIALAGCWGAFIEWYDFLAFAALLATLPELFFPHSDAGSAQIKGLALFGVGLLVRPLGAWFFGALADQRGRRTAFLTTILVMGVATFAIGLLPDAAQCSAWGWPPATAAAALLLLRLVQGFALGGEIGSANVYLAEQATPAQRGFATSFLQWMGGLGILAATALMAGLQATLDRSAFIAWGWRIPFLLSAVLLLLSVRARLALLESPVYGALRAAQALSRAPLHECLHDRVTLARMALLLFSISASGSVLFFLSQVHSPLYLKTVLHLDAALVDRVALLATLTLLPLISLCGALSDHAGRRPLVLSGMALGALSVLPVYWGLGHWAAGGSAVLFALLLLPVLALALVTGPQTALLSELFPARTRNTAVGLPHNLAAGWVGGLLPLIIAAINAQSGSALLGLLYPTAWLLLAFVLAVLFLPETRGRDLAC